MKQLTTLAPTAALALATLALLAACSKPPPPPGPLARGEIPDTLSAAFVQIEITPQSSEGEGPPASLTDAMQQKRPAPRIGYLVAPDLVIAIDPAIPPRFVREWRVRQTTTPGSAEFPLGQTPATTETAKKNLGAPRTATARPIAWAADHNAMLLKLDTPLPGARPLEFPALEKIPALSACFSIDYTIPGDWKGDWKNTIRPLSETTWWLSANGERAHPVPGSLIATPDGAPAAFAFAETVPADDTWKTPWRDWQWIYEDDLKTRHEKLTTTAAPALIFADIKLRPLPVRAGDNPYTMQTRPDDDPSTKPQPALVLTPRRVLVLTPLTNAYTARLENVTLRLPGDKQVNARFIATLADYGALVVEPEHDIEAPLALPAAPPDWNALYLHDRLLLTIDLRLQGEARLARPGLTRLTSAKPGWLGVLTPTLADTSSTVFLFDTDGNLLGIPLQPRATNSAIVNTSFMFPMSQNPRTTIVPAATLATYTTDPANTTWADPANIPVAESEERALVWLGVDLQPLTRELAQAQGVAEQTQNGSAGGLVTKVYPDSPAARAGLRTGDVLLRMRRENEAQIIPIRALATNAYTAQMFANPNQQIPDSMYDRLPPPWPLADSHLNQTLKQIGAGKTFEIDYARDGEFSTAKFTAEKGPSYYGTAPEATFKNGGLNVKTLTFETRAFYKIPDDKTALIVSRVVAGSRASVAGLRPYDLIIEVNDQPVTTPAAFAEQAKTGGTLRLLTRRMSQTRIVTLDLGAE